MYRLTPSSTIIRLADGASIPADPGNRDYQQYLADVAKGATVEPADPVQEPVKQRDLAAEFDALKSGLVAKGVVEAEDIESA